MADDLQQQQQPQIKLSAIRARFPMYANVGDDQLLIALRQKYYPQIPPAKFYNMIDYDTQRQQLQKENLDQTNTWVAGAEKGVMDAENFARKVLPGVSYTPPDATQRAADEALMKTRGGFWGNLGYNAALTAGPMTKAAQGLSSLLQAGGQALRMSGPLSQAVSAQSIKQAVANGIQAVAPYLGAAGGGAGAAAMVSPENTGTAALEGAAAGAAGEGAGRVLSAGWGAAKRALVEPWYGAGRDRILRRTLDKFAADPAAVRQTLANPPEPLVIGTQPTLAEITGDPGIAQYQRAMQARSPQVANALHESDVARVAAYRNVLENMTGDEASRKAAQQTLETEGRQAYERLFNTPLDMTNMPQEVILQGQQLAQRPVISDAMTQARINAQNAGRPMDDTQIVRGLHNVKKILDDKYSVAIKGGNNAEAAGYGAAREDLLKYLDVITNGEYSNTSSAYAALARPGNQQDVADYLLKKGLPALGGRDPNLTRTSANAYTSALDQGKDMVRRASGMNMTPEQLMEPGQWAQMQAIGDDMARRAASQEAARITGSPTAQLLEAPDVADNLKTAAMHALTLKTGIPVERIAQISGMVDKMPFNMKANAKNDLIAQVLTDPEVAQRVMSSQDPKTWMQAIQPGMAQAAAQAASGFNVANQ